MINRTLSTPQAIVWTNTHGHLLLLLKTCLYLETLLLHLISLLFTSLNPRSVTKNLWISHRCSGLTSEPSNISLHSILDPGPASTYSLTLTTQPEVKLSIPPVVESAWRSTAHCFCKAIHWTTPTKCATTNRQYMLQLQDPSLPQDVPWWMNTATLVLNPAANATQPQ